MTEKSLPIHLRSMTEGDIGFVFNSWLKSFRHSNFAKDLTNTVYFNEHHKVIERTISSSEVIIACDSKDLNQVYGYICAGKVDGIFVLHYIYVKHTFRKMGIGKALLNAFDHDSTCAALYTHHNRTAEKLAPIYNLLYHPYILINDYKLEKIQNSEVKESHDQA